MKLHNTRTRTDEEFKPLNDTAVRLYTCGPTVYGPLHVGNWVAYIRWDTLVRTLQIAGYEVERVMNITDVGHLVSDADEGEDKMIKGARREGVSAWDVAKRYSEDFMNGMASLNLIKPEHIVLATQYIPQQIKLISTLEAKGYTYKTSDGIYFNTAKFPKYAEFARLDLEGMKAGARVAFNDEKRNPSDFALWKFSPESEQRDMEWDSPWGKGFPGWHIECSAIALDILGETLDIHTGGIDHIPVHHTNEIAQSEAATGKRFVNYWLHNAHLLVDGTKISKSLNNGFTLSQLEDKGFSAMDFRLFTLQSHYRTESNFTWDNLQAAKNRLRSFQAVADLRFQLEGRAGGTIDPEAYAKAQERVLHYLQDDMDTPKALAALSEIMQNSENQLPATRDSFEAFLTFVDEAFGLQLLDSVDIEPAQKEYIAAREEARKSKDWQTADDMRNRLLEAGVTIRDTSSGPVWSRE